MKMMEFKKKALTKYVKISQEIKKIFYPPNFIDKQTKIGTKIQSMCSNELSILTKIIEHIDKRKK